MADETKTKSETKADAKRAYAVLRPVRHDGKLYLPSADGAVQIRLTDAEAAELKALAAIGDLPA